MKALFLSFILLLIFNSCEKKAPDSKQNEIRISNRVSFIRDTKGLSLHSGKFDVRFDSKSLPLKRVILLNASMAGYISTIELQDKVIGVSSPRLIYDPTIRSLIQQNRIQNVGSEQKYDIEKIIALKPDAIFTNYIASFDNAYALLRKAGIKIIFLDGYLEQNPLEKAAYLKVFGSLFGAERKTDSLYRDIVQHYGILKKRVAKTSDRPVVISNVMYGNHWFVPEGGNSSARFFKDAGADYPWADLPGSNSKPLSFEEVFAKAEKAKYWVNVPNQKRKSDLLVFNPSYSKLNPYKNGRIYTVGNRMHGDANDYFQSGSVHADRILQDYINIFHPGLLKDSTLIYMKQLK